jgi:very-short-patch-repair endonuclease
MVVPRDPDRAVPQNSGQLRKSQHSPARGAGEHSPARGASQHSPARGAGQHSPARGAGQRGRAAAGTEIDRAIAAEAGRQHGLITTRQLLDIGLAKGAIEHRTESGRLHRLHQGVYGVGFRPISPYAHALAAVLACGGAPHAALSHSSAATLWGITKRWLGTLEVTARTARSRPQLRVHCSKSLGGRDVTWHYGIPVTTPARTVLDNAPRLADAALARAVNDQRLAGYLSLATLAEVVARHPNAPGRRRLLAHLVDPRRAPTRSEFEDAFLLFARNRGLPEPEVNTEVVGHEVDMFFRAHQLVVELDGWESHSGRTAFEGDRDRDADLLAAAIATVRITWERMNLSPARGAARLQAILDQRAPLRR